METRQIQALICFEPGDLVSFAWDYEYMAPKAICETPAKNWDRVLPNDIGLVVAVKVGKTPGTTDVTVMFRNTNSLVNIRSSMLKRENS